MSRDVLFQMWEPFRQSLIAGHLFYVEQARKRLLSQFDDIDADPLRHVGELSLDADHQDHTHLKVTDAQIQAFSDAIVSFWSGVPENIFNDENITIPGWFEQAVNQDIKAAVLSVRSAAP